MKLARSLSIALAVAFAAPALADRAPTADERAKIEKSLSTAGFKTWEEIEFDDGMWEVDDAVAANGRIYDLKLDPRSFKIVKRVLD